ncbi:MAG: hypothetical protein A2Y62_12810 [Candidatus Fischerbacteria bacterium RBG_13_37_8]|uniref:Fibronectin type-III domain-containing protein n=1 Tax=Candidatus Fischerbacteria bacterium RBG_13_37_8 TaxID=1817863 RepID=A0A1F5VQ53_9BACT|nr:MAG: hypothetical protein A2Y62_12810 [Candidatus Fischerbacteria bacterium RBG_13_37_8]
MKSKIILLSKEAIIAGLSKYRIAGIHYVFTNNKKNKSNSDHVLRSKHSCSIYSNHCSLILQEDIMYKKIGIGILLGILFFSTSLFGQWLNWYEESPSASGAYRAVVAADFNWDNLIDIAAAPTSGGIQIWYRTPSGWNPTPEIITSTGTYRSLAAGDINYDGTTDLVGSGTTIGAWLHNFISGTFIWEPANNFNPAPAGSFNSIALANINQVLEDYGCVPMNDCDGMKIPFPNGLDIIVTDNTDPGHGIKVYRWAGYIFNNDTCQGSWELEVVPGLPGNGYYTQVISTDFNLDSSLDLAASKDGGIDVLFRSLAADVDGCHMDDKNGNFSPEWRLQNGASGQSDILPSHGNYKSIASADINNDLFPDLIASGVPTERPDNAYGIEVWYGTRGTIDWLWFKEFNVSDPLDSLLIPGTYLYVVISDFHNDNILDIAAGTSSNGIKVWRGQYYIDNPNMPCPPAINPAVKECPEPKTYFWYADTPPVTEGNFPSLSTSDINGDGKNDLAGADFNATSGDKGVKAYLETSPNTFNFSGWYPVDIDSFPEFTIFAGMKFSGTNVYGGTDGMEAFAPFLGPDLDTTGPMIIATVEDLNPSDNQSEVKIFKTDGEGKWEPECTPLAEGAYEDAIIVNINNDRFFDVVAIRRANAGAYGIRAWLQIATCVFQEISNGLSGTGNNYNEVVVVDINNDGFNDIIAAMEGAIQLWCGLPASPPTLWTWVQCGTLGDGRNTRSIVAKDFNEDGFVDVVGCSYSLSGPHGLTHYYQMNGGTQWGTYQINTSIQCQRVYSPRFTTCLPNENDEHWDIVASSLDSGIAIFRHVLSGSEWTWSPIQSPIASNNISRAIALDIDLNGRTDLVARNTTNLGLSTYNWDCVQWNPATSDSGFICTDMDTADFNNDLLPDLVSTCQNQTNTDHVLRVSYAYSTPNVPSLINPPNGATLNTREPQFQFSSSSSYTNCFRFKIELEDGNNLSIHNGAYSPKGWNTICYDSTQVATYNFQVDDIFPEGLPNGNYFWTALTYDGFRQSNSSLTRVFTVNPTDQTPPSEVQDILVEKTTGGVLLKWNKVPETDVNRYRIFRGNNSTFPLIPSSMIGQISSPPTNPVTFADTKPSTGPLMFYKVKAVDTTGNVGP